MNRGWSKTRQGSGDFWVEDFPLMDLDSKRVCKKNGVDRTPVVQPINLTGEIYFTQGH